MYFLMRIVCQDQFNSEILHGLMILYSNVKHANPNDVVRTTKFTVRFVLVQ